MPAFSASTFSLMRFGPPVRAVWIVSPISAASCLLYARVSCESRCLKFLSVLE